MKYLVIFCLVSVLSVSAFADSLVSAVKIIHASSSGKLITVFGNGVTYSASAEDANDSRLDFDSFGLMSNVNALCDLSKQHNTATYQNGAVAVFCIAK